MPQDTKPKAYTTNHGVRFGSLGVDFEVHQCGICDVLWAMTTTFTNARRADLRGWKCPNGHGWVFHDGPTEEERLKQEAERLEQEAMRLSDRLAAERAHADQIQASLRATKGVVTRQKRKLQRVENGVCPECNRTFVNLGRHMETKHGHVTQ